MVISSNRPAFGVYVMSKAITISEIESQYADEWVLVEDPETDASHRVQSGRVVCHSKDRDEVYRQAIALKPARFAILYTGTIPHNTAIAV
jgi:hypothetical protein